MDKINNDIAVRDRPSQAALRVLQANELLQELSKEKKPVDEVEKITERAIAYSDRYLKLFPLADTMNPVIRLATFNFIREHPDAMPTDVLKALREKNQLVHEEIDGAKDKAFPSIGLELEIPYRLFPFDIPEFADISAALTLMEIPVTGEPSGNFPTEFQFNPTHTALSQVELIKGLQNYLPKEEDFSSIHVNIGIAKPEKMVDGYDFDEEMQKDFIMSTATSISDIMTLAYVPSKRIANRRKQPSVQLQDATSIKNDGEGYRIEFRTPQLLDNRDDFSVMVSSFQTLSCLLDPNNQSFDEVRGNFRKDVTSLLKKYQLEEDFPLYDKQRAVQLGEKAEIQKKLALHDQKPAPENIIDDARKLIEEYVQEIEGIRVKEHEEQLRENLSIAAD